METMATPSSLAFRDKLQALLNHREELLWTGRPRQGIVFRWVDLLLSPIGLLFIGVALFWLYTVHAQVLFMLAYSFMSRIFGVLYLLLGVGFGVWGLYLLVGRYMWDMYKRSQIFYGITNRRVIIRQGSTVHSFDVYSLTNLHVTQGHDGRGTVHLTPSLESQVRDVLQQNPIAPRPALEMIPNAQAVYELIQDIRS